MLSLLVVFSSFLWVDHAAITADFVPATRATLPGTVSQMIAVIEKHDYRRLIEEYGDPKLVTQMRNEGILDEVVVALSNDEGDGDGPTDQMLRTLKQIDWKRVRYSDQGAAATYTSGGTEEDVDEIRFIKIDDKWYFAE